MRVDAFRSAAAFAALVVVSGASPTPAERPRGTSAGAAMIRGPRVAAADAAREVYRYSFRGSPADGSQPTGTPVEDVGGSVYGVTSSGGRFGGGTVFKFSRTAHGIFENTIYAFGASGPADAWQPGDGLLIDKSGALYGTTSVGGSTTLCYDAVGQPVGCGAVFKLTPTGHGYTETILHRFTGGADGAYPNTTLSMDRWGALYGGTQLSSGAQTNGVVYKLTPTGSGYRFSALYTFGAYDIGPGGALLVDQRSGTLYGTSSGDPYNRSDHGMVFALTPTRAGYVKSVVHQFNGRDGSLPTGNLTMDAAGALYGMSYEGGLHADGNVFKLTPSPKGYVASTLHDFAGGMDGSHPFYDGLVFDAHGALYGTTPWGGPGTTVSAFPGAGTVYELTPTATGYRETILHTFANPAAGSFPSGGVLLDPAGFVVGTASGGGALGHGTLFALK